MMSFRLKHLLEALQVDSTGNSVTVMQAHCDVGGS